MGRPKALLPWPPPDGPQPAVACLVRALDAAGLGPIGVITGAHHDAIEAVLDPAQAAVIFNPLHETGQLASLRCGLTWASETGSPWALVTLVDVVGVRHATMRQLADVALTSSAAAWAVRPVCGQRHGHPVLWHRRALALIDAADPAQGARQVMRQLAAQGLVIDVPVDDRAVIRDHDTWEEYLRREP